MQSHQTRRQFFGAVAGLAAAGLAEAQSRKPNVLFLISDDLDCRIRCYGDPVAITPNIDRLAARGVRFDRAYCQYPLCNPTRSSVLSGRYPTSTRVFDNNTWLVLEKGQQTMQQYFQTNGYDVTLLGKIFHGQNRGFQQGDAKPANAAWSTPQERSKQMADDPEYWSKNHSPYRNMKVTPERYALANRIGALEPGDRGTDAVLADRAVEVLDKAGKSSNPFFLAVGFAKPHVPLSVPKEYFDMYQADAMPLPADFDTDAKPIEGYPRDEFRQNIDLFSGRPFTPQQAREAMRAYYACITYLDAQVGRLLDKLDQSGLGKNTIIVLFGDHGWHLSEKGMWAKGTLFEVAARAPLMISDPRIPTAGQTSPRVVEFLNMYPTLVDLCGLPKAPWLEGVSVAPLLRNPRSAWNRPAYTVVTRGWFLGRSVRTERWRYTEWNEGRRGSALFDHDHDPHEMRNLAQDTKHAPVVQEMTALLRKGPIARRP
ncbi:MAG: sulfatase [Candidatus Solibacter usitatus]|nr:sulfatase [Candidatus Solibacter usitatus]